MYALSYNPDAVADLRRLRAFDRARVLAAIREELEQDPLAMRGARKRIVRPDGRFIFQLRAGDFRVFYDVDAAGRRVLVRHVKKKGRKTTEEVL